MVRLWRRPWRRCWRSGGRVGVRDVARFATRRLRPPAGGKKTVSKSIVVLLTVALLTSCTSAGPAIDRATICAGWKPILVSRSDTLTEGTGRQILAHNVFGETQGCW